MCTQEHIEPDAQGRKPPFSFLKQIGLTSRTQRGLVTARPARCAWHTGATRAGLLTSAGTTHARLTLAHQHLRLLPARPPPPSYRYQVEREMRIHIQLDHINIIKLYAAFEDDKNVYMVQVRPAPSSLLPRPAGTAF